jgi:SAM-dependent methyltransferase
MTEQALPTGRAQETVDFDALYRGDFDLANRNERARAAGLELDCVPWDIGEPQPVLRELERSGQIRSEILDIGCGLGENAFYLAERGYRVVGLDAAPRAIERAHRRAQSLGLAVEFAVADATALRGYEGRFGTVIDSGLYHCLTDDQRATYITNLYDACQMAAWLHIVCFSSSDASTAAPSRISEASLRNALADGWNIHSVKQTTFTTAFTRHYIEQQAKPTIHDVYGGTELRHDQHGRLLVPAWVISAERR